VRRGSPGGPAAYFATLPIKEMVQAMQEAGVPAVVSNSAGTYLCNQALYVALHHAAQERLKLPTGFIHVPPLPEQVLQTPDAPSMALSTALLAVRVALKVVAQTLTP